MATPKPKPTPKATPKTIKFTGGLAKVLKPIKAAPMTPEDKAMLKLLQKKYPDLKLKG